MQHNCYKNTFPLFWVGSSTAKSNLLIIPLFKSLLTIGTFNISR
jgi:hypothetical protein